MTARRIVAHRVSGALLRRCPLPRVMRDSDKDDRGRLLIVGGSGTVPGSVVLATLAAYRAGVGKVQLATAMSVASVAAVTIPEALVLGLRTRRDGEIAPARSPGRLRDLARDTDAVLLGPGMSNPTAARAILRMVLRECRDGTRFVIDAGGLEASVGTRGFPPALRGRALITPHAGEMATLLGVDRTEVEHAPAELAAEAAARFGVVVVLKGAESWIASPEGTLYRYTGGGPGLATSGSGDVLAGIAAALVARGANPLTAALWSVFVHGAAGRSLARTVAPIGFFARELLDAIPSILSARSASP